MKFLRLRGALALALLAAGCGVNQVGTTPATQGGQAVAAPAPASIPGISAAERALLESTEVSALYALRATELDPIEVLDEVEETVKDMVDDIGDTVASGGVVETTTDAEVTLDKAVIATTQVTSTRNDTWFNLSHLTDGKLTSAWGPAAGDLAPSLTLNLNGCMSVSGIGLKHSGGVMVMIEVSKGGSWTTVATDLTPQEATLDMIELTDSVDADAVRLSFTGNVSKLLVCEVEVFGGACGTSPTPAPSATATAAPSAAPSTTPSTTPSTMPSASPTAQPSAEPTAQPTAEPSAEPTTTPSSEPTPMPTTTPGGGGGGGEDCGCHTTGGGWILSSLLDVKNPKISFGFNAKGAAEAKGKVNILDHSTKAHFKGDVTSMACSGNTSTIQGMLKTGLAFTLVVTDNGEPGRADTFLFTSGVVRFAGLLGGGNIQQHGSCN